MIADAHVDLLMEVAYRERRLDESDVFASTWLPLLQQGGVGLQVCPVYVDIVVQPEGALREALSLAASFHRALRECDARVVQISTAADLDAVEAGERIGLMLSLEGVECFGVETWPADVFHALGVRMAGLTWNRRNAFADGAAEDGGGLSRLGRELVDRLVSLGVILDLAHASRGTFAEILERAGGAPVLCSHGACRVVYDTPRNLDDDQLRSLADGRWALRADAAPHRDRAGAQDARRGRRPPRARDRGDGARRVCLGGDFTQRLWEAMPPPPETKDGLLPPGITPGLGIEGLTGPEHYPALVERLGGAGLGRRGGCRRDRRQPPALPPRLGALRAITPPARPAANRDGAAARGDAAPRRDARGRGASDGRGRRGRSRSGLTLEEAATLARDVRSDALD